MRTFFLSLFGVVAFLTTLGLGLLGGVMVFTSFFFEANPSLGEVFAHLAILIGGVGLLCLGVTVLVSATNFLLKETS